MSAPDLGITHDLSLTGGRPLCGADPVSEAEAHEPARLVNCPACLRLLADETRREAHAARPRVDESEG